MNSFPISKEIFLESINELGISQVSKASIRETVALIRKLEQKSGSDFIRMDMGVPGLPTPQLGVDAEVEALKQGKSSQYAQIDGIPELKNELSRFAKSYMDISVTPKSCLVTAGSMMGAMISFMVAARREKSRQGILFIDPGFPVQKKQAKVLNLPIFSFDIYDYRGEKLYDKLEELCARNGVSTIIYSNPNNPTWVCLTEEELKAIAAIADKHDVIILEDLAYFGMDFRKNYNQPGKAPFQPTIAKYTDNYFVLFSSSKAFSYAGQRVGALMVSDKLYEREFPGLLALGDNTKLGPALIQDGIYVVTAGACHTAQYGLAAMLQKANDGRFDFLDLVKIYGQRAEKMKAIFLDNGFRLLYDYDGEQELADGFYFTISYPELDAEKMVRLFLQCGLGAISLTTMGCCGKSGLRISSSKLDESKLPDLANRLKLFEAICSAPINLKKIV